MIQGRVVSDGEVEGVCGVGPAGGLDLTADVMALVAMAVATHKESEVIGAWGRCLLSRTVLPVP